MLLGSQALYQLPCRSGSSRFLLILLLSAAKEFGSVSVRLHNPSFESVLFSDQAVLLIDKLAGQPTTLLQQHEPTKKHNSAAPCTMSRQKGLFQVLVPLALPMCSIITWLCPLHRDIIHLRDINYVNVSEHVTSSMLLMINNRKMLSTCHKTHLRSLKAFYILGYPRETVLPRLASQEQISRIVQGMLNCIIQLRWLHPFSTISEQYLCLRNS